MAGADLRGILHYIPQFRGQTFVVSIDGALLEGASKPQLMVDLALLHSLSIRLVLVFGARHQVEHLCKTAGHTPANADGTGPTDAATLEHSLAASSRLSAELLRALTTVGLRAAASNAIIAREAGVIDGVDFLHTGVVEANDAQGLKVMLKEGMVPLIPPLSYNRRGNALRLNSDLIARKIAQAIDADKILYLADQAPPVEVSPPGNEVPAESATSLAKELLDSGASTGLASKFEHAGKACTAGVSRGQILDGSNPEHLLSELFSNEGVGTMVHADDYRLIRPAQEGDAQEILSLIEDAVAEGELLSRSHQEIEAQLSDFSILEVDGNPIACVALHLHPHETEGGEVLGNSSAEVACLSVRQSHKGLGYGTLLLEHAEQAARQAGANRLFALTTRAPGFFESRGDFQPVEAADLPEIRQAARNASGRESRVLAKDIER